MHQLLLTALLAGAQADNAARPAAWTVAYEGALPYAIADTRVLELGGAPGLELLVIGATGAVQTWKLPVDPTQSGLRGDALLAQPTRSAIALAS